MSLGHALLGLLSTQPSTGYELRQRFDSSLRNAWYASHSQIYPELEQLHEAGMVEVVAEGSRGSRTWAVTEAGREELRRWLTQTEPNRNVRNEPFLRLFLLLLLPPDDRRLVLEREAAYSEQTCVQLAELAERLDALGKPSAFRPIIDLGQRIDIVIRTWLQEQIEATHEQ